MSAADDPLREVTQASDTVWEGVFLRVLRDRVRLPDGHETTREYLRHPGAAAMIALTDAGEVVLERQFRYPLGCSIVEPAASWRKKPATRPSARKRSGIFIPASAIPTR